MSGTAPATAIPDRGSHVLLVVGGGIAAYKSLELIRLLGAAGLAVTVVLTRAGAEFVTPLSLQTLSGRKVHTELFSLTEESEIGHIELSRSARLIVVCPASASLLARMEAGIADDLATTLLLATDTPVLAAPAMNVRMWQHPATQANLATLRERGVRFVGPEAGIMACNEYGMGRLAEPPAIRDSVLAMLDPGAALELGRHGAGLLPLAGRHALVTAGPTHEPIDPLRFLANRSSGKQGYAIAAALRDQGARVTLVSGPVALSAPDGITRISVETAAEMRAACLETLPADIAVLAAAVGDWRVRSVAAGKIKKQPGGEPPHLSLVRNPDILAELSAASPHRPRLVVGFAAETDDLLANAARKLQEKGCDWLLANDVSLAGGIMGGEMNQVHLLSPSGIEAWPREDKRALAGRLAARIAQHLSLAQPA